MHSIKQKYYGQLRCSQNLKEKIRSNSKYFLANAGKTREIARH